MKTYTRNGKKYVSVTEIVSLMYPFDRRSFNWWCRHKGINPGWVDEESRRVGTKVHGWLENRFLKIDSWADFRPLTAREATYLKTVGEVAKALKIMDMETVVFNDDWGYAGTYDIMLEDGTIVDVKTWGAWKGEYKRSSDKMQKVTTQLSMYAEAADTWKIAVCILLPEGGYEYEELKFDDSWKDWITMNRDKLI
jgi:hypothetical protein